MFLWLYVLWLYITEEKKKHFILFLKNVNNDQWEALTSMKFTNRHAPLFVKCDILKALKILADIKANTKGGSCNVYSAPTVINCVKRTFSFVRFQDNVTLVKCLICLIGASVNFGKYQILA